MIDEHAGSQTPQLLFEFLRGLGTIEKEMEKRAIAERQQGGGDLPALRNVDVNNGGD
jgi:hypothetical protein